ncbi:MAG TPA: DUF397 domain-containing protein [Streptosporangiaceae bacterium]
MTTPPTVIWRKSSHSHSEGECVEVAVFSSGVVGVRDSKDPDGPPLMVSRRAFAALLDRAKSHR